MLAHHLQETAMALYGLFIGIDCFADPKIRELTGCRRDALALSSLFSDTLPAFQATVLIDKQATNDAVRMALRMILGTAGKEDTVIISFSSHGTKDHRLVTYDSDMSRLSATTIDMSELAAIFKTTQAKVSLFILDCCFSGGAPARILEDSPVLRSETIPLNSIAGIGRILIAASGTNEPALEHARHGLLTFALIEAFQASSATISLPTVMDQVMQRVRAEAARKGHVQTPVLFGYVEGGLFLPSLKRGHKFFTFFPEAKGTHVSQNISDLSVFGLPSAVINAWKELFPTGLNLLQLSAVNESRVMDGESLLVVAPTSSGKTFVGELAAAKAITDKRKAVFLFPYKALVNEKFDQFKHLYGAKLGMRVVRCTGDHSDQAWSFLKGKYDLAVLTYEMFLNMTIANPATLNVIGLVVIDELQFLSDKKRGIVVELLLTNLLAARKRGITPQLIGLSAVIGQLNSVDEWLECKTLVQQERPVPLIEGVIDRSGVFQYVDLKGFEQSEQFIPSCIIIQRKQESEKQDIIVPLVRSLLSKSAEQRIIIFRNRKGSAQGAAEYLANELKLPPALEAIATLPTNDPSTSLPILRKCLENGTAFHTTDLGYEERNAVEQEFRKRDGSVKVLVATATVAAGVNTPASTVIISEHEFLGEEKQPYTVAEYKNMAGRAGRYGYNDQGLSILLADTVMERQQLFRKYVRGIPEPICSSFDLSQTETWLLRLLAQVSRVQKSEVIKLLASTFGGFVANRADSGWLLRTTQSLAALLSQMIELDLVEEEDGFLNLTLLGRACGNSSLAFRSAIQLVRMIRTHGPGLTGYQLIALLQVLPELDAIYTPQMKKGHGESRWVQDVLRHFGRPTALLLQQQSENNFAYIARCKRVMVLRSWVQGVPMEQIEKDATKNPYNSIGAGNVRGFADTTRFHLRSASYIVTALLIENGPTEQEVESILKQLEFGLPEDVHDLLSLPLSLSRGEYLFLRRHGVCTASSLCSLTPERLSELLGHQRAKEFSNHR